MAELFILTKLNDQASGGLKSLRREIEGIEASTGIASRGFSSLQSVVTGVTAAVGAGAVVAGVAIGDFVKDGIEGAIELEAQMSGIAAVLNKTADEVQPLNNLINELAINPQLKVTTEEAASSIELLARNGLKMDAIMDGAAMSVIALANSTGGSFAQSADIATDAIVNFNDLGGNFSATIDGITAVTTSSKFSIDDYALALAQAGGVAGSVGVEFDDFNTAISGMAGLFASGSDAGTSFKVFLQRLAPTTNTAIDAMQELGLMTFNSANALEFLARNGVEPVNNSVAGIKSTFFDYVDTLDLTDKEITKLTQTTGVMQNQFFDTEGNLRDMGEIAGVLQDAFAGLSEEQRNQALSTIFGTDAMRAAVGLFKLGEEGFNSLQGTMGETKAFDSAATRVDNVAGAIEIAGGIMESVGLQIGTAFLPVIRILVDEFARFAETNAQGIISFFAGIATAISSFVSRAQEGEAVIPNVTTFVYDLASAFGIANSTVSGFLSVVEGVSSFFSSVIPPIASFISQFVSAESALTAFGIVLGSVVISAVGGLVAALAPALVIFGLITVGVELLRQAFDINFAGIVELTDGLVTAVGLGLEGVRLLLTGDVAGAIDQFRLTWETGFSAAVEFIGNLRDLAIPYFEQFFTGISDWFASQDWGALALTAVSKILESFNIDPQPVIDRFSPIFIKIGEFLTNLGQGISSFVSENLTPLLVTLGGVGGAFLGFSIVPTITGFFCDARRHHCFCYWLIWSARLSHNGRCPNLSWPHHWRDHGDRFLSGGNGTDGRT